MTEPTRDELKALIEKMGEAILHTKKTLFQGTETAQHLRPARAAYLAYKAQQSPADELGLPWHAPSNFGEFIYDLDGNHIVGPPCRSLGPKYNWITISAHIVNSANRDHLYDELVKALKSVVDGECTDFMWYKSLLAKIKEKSK